MMSSDPTGKEQKFHKDSQMATLRRRALAVLFGEHPTGAERLSFHAALAVAESLPDLVDLTDEDLREALQTTMLRILRVPSSPLPRGRTAHSVRTRTPYHRHRVCADGERRD